MSDVEGDRPTGAPRPPAPRPIAPKPRSIEASAARFSDHPARDRIRAVDLLSGPFREALAEHLAEIAGTEHVKAA